MNFLTQKYFTGASGNRTPDLSHGSPAPYALYYEASQRQRREKASSFDGTGICVSQPVSGPVIVFAFVHELNTDLNHYASSNNRCNCRFGKPDIGFPYVFLGNYRSGIVYL